jgi:hypothetical protein
MKKLLLVLFLLITIPVHAETAEIIPVMSGQNGYYPTGIGCYQSNCTNYFLQFQLPADPLNSAILEFQTQLGYGTYVTVSCNNETYITGKWIGCPLSSVDCQTYTEVVHNTINIDTQKLSSCNGVINIYSTYANSTNIVPWAGGNNFRLAIDYTPTGPAFVPDQNIVGGYSGLMGSLVSTYMRIIPIGIAIVGALVITLFGIRKLIKFVRNNMHG